MSSEEYPSRRLTDPRALRALSHPVRVALMELLANEGPLTATEAGERLGESPANCSFHLRTLAKHGFIEEAEGGQGRQRPWRVVPMVTQVIGQDLGPEAKVASRALGEMLRERAEEQVRHWAATRDQYPQEWQDAAGETYGTLHLTVGELKALEEELSALSTRYLERMDPSRRPPGTVPVAVVARVFPLQLPHVPHAAASGGTDRTGPADRTDPPHPAHPARPARPAATAAPEGSADPAEPPDAAPS